MQSRRRVRWGWLVAAIAALAVTFVALGWQSGTCSHGEISTCTIVDATSPELIAVVAVGLVATVWFAIKALRR